MRAETMESAAADADAAPLDLLLTDAALGVLNRVNPAGSGLRLAAALAARPRADPRASSRSWPRSAPNKTRASGQASPPPSASTTPQA